MTQFTFTNKVLTEETVVLPKYFKVSTVYYMILDDQTFVRVKDYTTDMDKLVGLWPCIEQEKMAYAIDYLSTRQKNGEVVEITADDFHSVFIKVATAIQKLIS